MHAPACRWMLSRRARDLGLLTKEGVWDMNQLAYAMHLRDHARASAVLEVRRRQCQDRGCVTHTPQPVLRDQGQDSGATGSGSRSRLRHQGRCRAPAVARPAGWLAMVQRALRMRGWPVGRKAMSQVKEALRMCSRASKGEAGWTAGSPAAIAALF